VEAFVIRHGTTLYTALMLSSLAIVAIWEHLAARRQLRANMATRWAGNLSLLFGNGILMYLVYGGWGIAASVAASQHEFGLMHHVALPMWLEVVLALLLLDLGHFAIHWTLHNLPALWRIHRLHHTDLDFDFTTAARFHPFEAIVETGANLLVVVLVGAPPLSVTLYALSYAATTVWVHGNVRMPDGWDVRFRRILVTPDMHRTHHSQRPSETNSNYGGFLSLWDRLFGTYVHEPAGGHQEMAIGIREFDDPRHIRLGWMLRNPFLRPTSLRVRAAGIEPTAVR
jgi:sterol desaturase/sphingolipid hydroxylase (fatty acid hydroxylase superfamily)